MHSLRYLVLFLVIRPAPRAPSVFAAHEAVHARVAPARSAVLATDLKQVACEAVRAQRLSDIPGVQIPERIAA